MGGVGFVCPGPQESEVVGLEVLTDVAAKGVGLLEGPPNESSVMEEG